MMIPNSIDDVTPAWLSEILQADIKQIFPTQIGQGVGLMGDIYRVEIHHTKPETNSLKSVVVKLPSSFEANRAQGLALGMFQAEVRFYNELASRAPIGIPDVYYANINANSAEFVIVMEDLSHLTMVEQAVGMNVEQALAAVTVLAKIHAVWWDKVRLPELEWIPSMISPRIEYVDQLLVQAYPDFKAKFQHSIPPEGMEIYKLFAGNYHGINSVIADRTPWTLAHQDYRVENLMFGSSSSGTAIVLDLSLIHI